MSQNINHRSINHSVNVLSTTGNKSINILPSRLVSNHVIPLGSNLTEKSTSKKSNNTLSSGSSIKENDDRLNRMHFFFKDIMTLMPYMDIFMFIVTTYPLVQSNTNNDSPKIQYLCVADTSKSSNKKLISIHLCFEKKVNFKHKFLNHLFRDLKTSDYLYMANGDKFNNEIKLFSNGRYMESSANMFKKEKNMSSNDYNEKKDAVAGAALLQESFNSAVAIVRNNLKFEYLARGDQMRRNLDYELQMAKKQKRMEYKSPYDPTTFKIPEEHRQSIEEWLEYDFRMRIEEKITRCRCLFMVGPTKHGIFFEFF